MGVRAPAGLSRRLLTHFDGGLNLRDAPGELDDSESPDMMNVTLDERGGVVKRLGYQRDNTAPIGAGAPLNLFYSEALDQLILQIGAQLYRRTSASVYVEITRAGPLAAFTTAERVGMADLAGKLYVVHPVDGVLEYTGAGSLTSVNTTVKGNALATWQNKLWATGLTNTVWWSKAGLGATWTTAEDFIQVRDVNDDVCTAIGFGQALDQGAVPSSGLLVYKRGSTHRITNSASGEYTTISAEAGAAGPLAIAHLNGITATVNDQGVWVTDGEQTPLLASTKIAPIFRSGQLNTSQLSAIACGIYRDRILISIPRTGSTVNDLTLEYQPEVGWFVAHDFTCSAYATLRMAESRPYALSTSANPNLLKLFTGGADDKAANGTGGVNIDCRFRTRWFEPVDGTLSRLRRLRIQHRGSFSVYSRKDFSTAETELIGVTPSDANDNAAVYGTGIYGTSVYGENGDEEERYSDIYSLGFAKAWALEMRHTGSSSVSASQLLQGGAAPEVGEVALYELHFDFVPLAYA